VPSGCSADDFVRGSLPAEWLSVGVLVCDVSVDGGLQIDDADEANAFEAAAKKPSTAFSHEALGG